MVSIVYYVTITVVTPSLLAGHADKVQFLIFNTRGSFMQALDGLGYGLMSLATFFATFAFESNRGARLVRWSLFNGVLALRILPTSS